MHGPVLRSALTQPTSFSPSQILPLLRLFSSKLGLEHNLEMKISYALSLLFLHWNISFQTDMPSPRSLIYVAECCSSILTVDLYVNFQVQLPSVVAPNSTLQEIAFGRSWIPSPRATASFLQILFPNLKVFNVTADKDYLVPDTFGILEVKQAWESAQEMASLCGAECFAKTYY
ncbi:hypothetical protein DL96DRAFT_1590782 [Flagelloscypha sp. PMI_526]|nr:hypothetical protein DL96DRAFT_1590782 [Flagelloscypha sp. PMI_526]